MFSTVTIAAVAAIVAAGFAAMHTPRLLALGIAKLIWHMGHARGLRLNDVLMTQRPVPADRWARTSREDRQLLSRSFAAAMNRTQMRSLLPTTF